MTKPVGGEAVLLQPGLLPGAEPRRGAEAGAAPTDGFTLMLAGLLGSAPAATPAPLADPAPALASPRQAGALPWDALAAAAEETGRLAAAFQMPLAAMPPAMEGDIEAPGLVVAGLVPSKAAPALPEGGPEGAPTLAPPPRPATSALPAAPAAQINLPAGGAPQMPSAGSWASLPPDLPPLGSPAADQGALPVAAPVATPVAAPAAPGTDAAAPAAAPIWPAAPSAQAERAPAASPLAADALLPAAPALPAADAAMAPLPQPERVASLPAALLQEAQAFAVPASQRRPVPGAASGQPASEPPAGPEVAAATPRGAAPTLLPAAVAAPAPVHERTPHPFAPPSDPVSAGDKVMPEQSLPFALPATEPLPEPLPTPTPTPTPLVSGPALGSAALPPAPAALPAQAPVPQSRLAAEAAPQLVLRMAQAAKKDGVETILVDLRPPELGRVELQMTFRDGTVQVVMRAEQADTFEALRHERHNLVHQMEQAGLQLGGSGLDLQQGPLPQPKPQPEQAFAGNRATAADPEQEAEEQAKAAAPPRRAASDSLIDIIT